jgi:alkylated DNA nucleotide flippase Atl1
MTGSDVADAVRALIEEVPAGKVVTYGDLGHAVDVGARQIGRILASGGHDVAWWRVVDASGHPPENAQDAAADRYVAEGTPFHRTGGRVTVNLSACRWSING